jgi:hypothetical protein
LEGFVSVQKNTFDERAYYSACGWANLDPGTLRESPGSTDEERSHDIGVLESMSVLLSLVNPSLISRDLRPVALKMTLTSL